MPIIEIGKVACTEDIVIPPRAEYILPTQISYECDNNDCLVEPNHSFEAIKINLKIASCLVNMQSKFIPVRILNPNQKPVELKMGETIGYSYEIIETETITNEISLYMNYLRNYLVSQQSLHKNSPQYLNI